LWIASFAKRQDFMDFTSAKKKRGMQAIPCFFVIKTHKGEDIHINTKERGINMRTSWERRGHDRKPNFIVRGIYAIADWLGDFAYLVNQTKQSMTSFFLLTVNLIMLICIIITSAAHSLQLLRYAGAAGGLEYFLLIVWELLFITSSFLLDRAFKLGKYGEWQLWLPFVMGLAFIEASNIVGMAGNLAGLLIGGSTFIVLLSLKWMLIWQLKNPSTKPTPTTPTTEMLPQTTMADYNKTAYADIARLLEKETGEKVGERTGEQAGEKEEDETAVETLKRQRSDNIETDEKHQGKQEKTPRGTNQPKREKTSTISPSPKREARIIRMAKKWYEENGRFPGRVNLSKIAKCSEYEARKVLEKLKQSKAS